MVYQYAKPKRSAAEEDEQDDFKFPFMDMEKEFGAAEGYTDMVHRIASASPSDVIFIHLNTPGGHMDTGVQIINAMRNSQAKIVTILESTAYSLGTLIFLAGDEMVVNEHCMMMFHNFNGGLIGKGNELVSELEATVKWFASLAKSIYVPFLTDEEVDRISRGEDMWMQTPEIKQRLENMVKVMVQKEAEERAAAKAAKADKPVAKKRVPKPRKDGPKPPA
jgi:ATP-dependent protease ClpP protease subunit